MNWRHIPIFALATLLTFILHEGAHWGMGKALGYDMWIKINSAGLASGEYSAEWHRQIVGAAGPFMTIIQAIIAYFIVLKHKAISAFAFLFAALMMRVMAMLVSINNPNDEAKIGIWFGLGPWALFILAVVFLLVLTLRGGSYMKLGWRTYGFAYLIVSITLTVIIFSESYLPVFIST